MLDPVSKPLTGDSYRAEHCLTECSSAYFEQQMFDGFCAMHNKYNFIDLTSQWMPGPESWFRAHLLAFVQL